MRGFGILIIIVLFLWLVWPAISRWLKRKAQEKTAEFFYRKMGMPPPYNENRRSRSTRRTYNERKKSEPIIPKEYAEDIEYTEIKEFKTETVITSEDKGVKYKKESQISDAEWTEIKISGSKK